MSTVESDCGLLKDRECPTVCLIRAGGGGNTDKCPILLNKCLAKTEQFCAIIFLSLIFHYCFST